MRCVERVLIVGGCISAMSLTIGARQARSRVASVQNAVVDEFAMPSNWHGAVVLVVAAAVAMYVAVRRL
jgi:hypothetical protein